MKKNRILPIVVLIILGILAGGFYFSPKKFASRVNPDDIDHFTVFNGRIGTSFQVEDPVYIKMIVRNLQNTSLKRSGIFVKDYAHMGYEFSVEGVNQNGRSLIPILFIKDNSTILKRPFIYTCGGELCTDFLKELEAENARSQGSADSCSDSEGNQITYYASTETFVVNGEAYYATGNSYGDAICGEHIKNTTLPLSDGRIITAWSPIYEYTVCVFIDGIWYEYSAENSCVMNGIILEINDGTMTVEPLRGSWELNLSDQYIVPLEHMNASPEPQVGDLVEITYDGSIEETYPAGLGSVSHIAVLGDPEQDIFTDMEENTEEPTGARMEISIDNIYYSNTEIAVPIEPDESAVEYVEIPAGGSSAIEAFAKIQDDKESYLVCLIDGEWYKFLPKKKI